MASLEETFEPSQIELFRDLAEAFFGVPRDKRDRFMVLKVSGGTHIQGNGLLRSSPRVVYDDIMELARYGLLDVDYMTNGSGINVNISSEGRRIYQELMTNTAEATDQIEEHVWRYFNAPEFGQQFPRTFTKWRDAIDYVWGSESERDFSTIGHICREAMQEFATELIATYHVEGASQDPAKTRDRFSAVVNTRREVLGDRKSEVLDALFEYWRAVGDLTQRQEHAGQRQGSEDLVWEDGRRVVFQLGFVMFEAARTLQG